MTEVLRGGLLLALALIAGALLLLFSEDPTSGPSRVIDARRLTGYLGGLGLVAGLAGGVPEAYLTLGVYALVATPVLRVLTGVYFFRKAGDTPLVRITVAVLALLLISLFLVGPLVG